MLVVVARAIEGGEWAERGSVLRGMVHLRPSDGYRRLWVEEHEDDASDRRGRARDPQLTDAFVPSATAWRWVAEHRAAVAIDVLAGLLQPRLPSGQVERLPDVAPVVDLASEETRDRLLGREATHVYVLPLIAPGGAVAGMIALEASCRAATARAFVWPSCEEALDVLAALCAPYLTSLPLRPVAVPEPDELMPVVGRATAGLVEVLRVFAQQEETILIAGPTGVGKSRLARWCHERSKRKGQPFEVLDLLTVPEELQMGELVGWQKGAFTGAVRDTPGAIARAEKGTLFVDEIDKLSLKAQASLLRVLEERVYRPLGQGRGERRANVRFLIGTNADLHASVREKRFREDLYYRINVLPVKVPPLSERIEEVPAWARYMLARRGAEGGGDGAPVLSHAAEAILAGVSWPGNLRQLDNIIRRAYALALVERGAGGAGLVLEARHVERALAYDAHAEPSSVGRALLQAARAFEREAERRSRSTSPLTLDHASAFAGVVLAAAVDRIGGRDEAFRSLGRADLLKGRNHHRVLKRELERVDELVAALGPDAAPEIAALAEAVRALS